MCAHCKEKNAFSKNVRTFIFYSIPSSVHMTQKRNRPAFNNTIDPEVKACLMRKAGEKGVSASIILSALAKVYCNLPVNDVEQVIENDLKGAFVREQHLAFLQSVAEILPSQAKPVLKQSDQGRDDFTPDSWTLGKTGILAFFSPTGTNIGQVFEKALLLKTDYSLKRVLVVSPQADTVPPDARRAMRLSEFEIVSVQSLPNRLKKIK